MWGGGRACERVELGHGYCLASPELAVCLSVCPSVCLRVYLPASHSLALLRGECCGIQLKPLPATNHASQGPPTVRLRAASAAPPRRHGHFLLHSSVASCPSERHHALHHQRVSMSLYICMCTCNIIHINKIHIGVSIYVLYV